MHLVVDVALRTSEESILEAHGLQYHQLQAIMTNPQFVLAVEKLRKELEQDGASFKLKCQLQADHYLQKVHEMIESPDTDERVKTRLIEDVVNWGGLSAPAPVGGGIGGFSININFGENSKRGITIDAD
jgi:hypothetical protein